MYKKIKCTTGNKKKKCNKNKHKSFGFKTLFIYTIICIALFVVIYLVFSGLDCIPAGKNLSRKDWLSFVGSYLTFFGTSTVTFLTVLQGKKYKEIETDRINNERITRIEPIFSIRIDEKEENSCIIRLKNVAEFPVRNVQINDVYFFELLPVNEEKEISFFEYKDEIYGEYGSNKYEYPNKLVINYEDIDGNLIYQTFEYEPNTKGYEYGCYKLKNKEKCFINKEQNK